MSEITRREVLATAAVAQAAPALHAQPQAAMPRRRLLSSGWPAEKLARALAPRAEWSPHPRAADRDRWQALPARTRDAILAAGEKALSGDWPSLPATLFLDYVRNGNRSRYEAARNGRRNRLQALTLAECVEGKGRFLDQIANGIWLTCEESFWGVPAHMGVQRRGSGLPDVTENIIDLFAAETAAQLAWTEYLLGPQLAGVHPLVRERIGLEIERRVLSPYRSREDFGWMGFHSERPVNNWNPWINSNCLTCALLIGRESERPALVHKILTSLDRFLDGYHEDGGCDEGPSYWGHAGGSLYDNLELLHSASGGAVDFYTVPLVREIGRYIVRAHIADRWFTNFADASARVQIAGDLVFHYGKRIGDADMQALGAWAFHESAAAVPDGSLLRQLPALFRLGELTRAEARQPLLRDVWLPGVQVMAARRAGGSADGLYLAAQGGHNAESHNHNDVGNFIVYANGRPAIIDAGVEIYTAKTFSSRRYEIWTMQSAYHNLPTVNGVMQAAGREFAARQVSYRAGNDAAELCLDLAAAYPQEAGIETWARTLRLDRAGNQVEIRDDFVLRKQGGEITLTLMTPCIVATGGKGRITLSGGFLAGGQVEVAFPDSMSVTTEAVPTMDPRLHAVWGDRIFRVLLAAYNLPAKGQFVVRITQS